MLSNNINRMTEEHRKGKIKEMYHCVNNDVQGFWIEYYESGMIKNKYRYVDDEKQGKSFGYYENGGIEWECNYVNGKKHGESICYYEHRGIERKCDYEHGGIECKCNYVDDERHGEYVEYYENGDIQCTTNFVNGEIQGTFTQYHKISDTEKAIKEKAIDNFMYKNDFIEPTQKTEDNKKYDKYNLHAILIYGDDKEPEIFKCGEIIKYKNGEEKSKIYFNKGRIVGIYDN